MLRVVHSAIRESSLIEFDRLSSQRGLPRFKLSHPWVSDQPHLGTRPPEKCCSRGQPNAERLMLVAEYRQARGQFTTPDNTHGPEVTLRHEGSFAYPRSSSKASVRADGCADAVYTRLRRMGSSTAFRKTAVDISKGLFRSNSMGPKWFGLDVSGIARQ